MEVEGNLGDASCCLLLPRQGWIWCGTNLAAAGNRSFPNQGTGERGGAWLALHWGGGCIGEGRAAGGFWGCWVAAAAYQGGSLTKER